MRIFHDAVKDSRELTAQQEGKAEVDSQIAAEGQSKMLSLLDFHAALPASALPVVATFCLPLTMLNFPILTPIFLRWVAGFSPYAAF